MNRSNKVATCYISKYGGGNCVVVKTEDGREVNLVFTKDGSIRVGTHYGDFKSDSLEFYNFSYPED